MGLQALTFKRVLLLCLFSSIFNFAFSQFPLSRFPRKPVERRIHTKEEIQSAFSKKSLYSKAVKWYDEKIKATDKKLISSDTLNWALNCKIALKVIPKSDKIKGGRGCFCKVDIRCREGIYSYEVYDIAYEFETGMQFNYSGFDEEGKKQADEEVERLVKSLKRSMEEK